MDWIAWCSIKVLQPYLHQGWRKDSKSGEWGRGLRYYIRGDSLQSPRWVWGHAPPENLNFLRVSLKHSEGHFWADCYIYMYYTCI